MIKDNINSLIMASMKAKDRTRTMTLQLIKAEIQKVETAAGAKPYDEAQEISILRKMIKQHEDSIEQYDKANREDLSSEEKAQLDIIREFMPEEVSEDTISNEVDSLIQSGIEPVKKSMGLLIKSVKAKYPTADGSLVSKIVLSKIS